MICSNKINWAKSTHASEVLKSIFDASKKIILKGI